MNKDPEFKVGDLLNWGSSAVERLRNKIRFSSISLVIRVSKKGRSFKVYDLVSGFTSTYDAGLMYAYYRKVGHTSRPKKYIEYIEAFCNRVIKKD